MQNIQSAYINYNSKLPAKLKNYNILPYIHKTF